MAPKRKAVARKTLKKSRQASRTSKRRRIEDEDGSDAESTSAPTTSRSGSRKAYVLDEDEENAQYADAEVIESGSDSPRSSEEPEDPKAELGES